MPFSDANLRLSDILEVSLRDMYNHDNTITIAVKNISIGVVK